MQKQDYLKKRADFVIYYSRVAAALCLLVVGYCQINKFDTVPIDLQFMGGHV